MYFAFALGCSANSTYGFSHAAPNARSAGQSLSPGSGSLASALAYSIAVDTIKSDA